MDICIINNTLRKIRNKWYTFLKLNGLCKWFFVQSARAGLLKVCLLEDSFSECRSNINRIRQWEHDVFTNYLIVVSVKVRFDHNKTFFTNEVHTLRKFLQSSSISVFQWGTIIISWLVSDSPEFQVREKFLEFGWWSI